MCTAHSQGCKWYQWPPWCGSGTLWGITGPSEKGDGWSQTPHQYSLALKAYTAASGPEAICSRHAVVTGWQEKEQDKVNLTVLSATTVLQPPQARGTHSPRPPPWSRVEMLQTRRAQTSGTVLGRPVLAAPMQPALRSSCTCPGAPDRSASDSFTAARAQSSRRMEGGRQRAVSPAPLTKPNYPSLQWVSQPLPAPFLVLF